MKNFTWFLGFSILFIFFGLIFFGIFYFVALDDISFELREISGLNATDKEKINPDLVTLFGGVLAGAAASAGALATIILAQLGVDNAKDLRRLQAINTLIETQREYERLNSELIPIIQSIRNFDAVFSSAYALSDLILREWYLSKYRDLPEFASIFVNDLSDDFVQICYQSISISASQIDLAMNSFSGAVEAFARLGIDNKGGDTFSSGRLEFSNFFGADIPNGVNQAFRSRCFHTGTKARSIQSIVGYWNLAIRRWSEEWANGSKSRIDVRQIILRFLNRYLDHVIFLKNISHDLKVMNIETQSAISTVINKISNSIKSEERDWFQVIKDEAGIQHHFDWLFIHSAGSLLWIKEILGSDEFIFSDEFSQKHKYDFYVRIVAFLEIAHSLPSGQQLYDGILESWPELFENNEGDDLIPQLTTRNAMRRQRLHHLTETVPDLKLQLTSFLGIRLSNSQEVNFPQSIQGNPEEILSYALEINATQSYDPNYAREARSYMHRQGKTILTDKFVEYQGVV